eukprot:CAMPEP_0119015078 /NCGR_PEP_ID=MMETSP1176-20130426/10544_1 /TAXON_ID=265551 /ORGANISM="Synedropsis recta cf, Strain CCMP1620" /LENGTH=391 /DNA_ID=CAMNT_0006968343 /DNA_START=181 /DNA_END=1356 /DNA_ORIENTATION=+
MTIAIAMHTHPASTSTRISEDPDQLILTSTHNNQGRALSAKLRLNLFLVALSSWFAFHRIFEFNSLPSATDHVEEQYMLVPSNGTNQAFEENPNATFLANWTTALLSATDHVQEQLMLVPSNGTNQTFEENPNATFLAKWTQDLDADHSSCGRIKCFLRSTSNPNIGWLIAEDAPYFAKPGKAKKSSNLTVGEAMIKGWELAKSLEKEYGIHHFLVDSPFQLEFSSKSQRRQMRRNFFKHPNAERRFPLNRIMVQKVKTASLRSALIQYGSTELRGGGPIVSKTDHFVKDLLANHSDSFNRTRFVNNAKNGKEIALKILKEYYGYSCDFQVILDEYGRIYHLDFDRAFTMDTRQTGYRRYVDRSFSKILTRFRRDMDHAIRYVGNYSDMKR